MKKKHAHTEHRAGVVPQEEASEEVLCKKIQDELSKSVFGPEGRKQFSRGLDLILEDLKNHCTPVEWETMQQECTSGVLKWCEMSDQEASSIEELIEKVEQAPDTLQQVLNLSEKTMEAMYQSGLRYFEGKQWQAAKDVFWVLAILSPLRPNLWIALGLMDQQEGKFEEALEHFAKAMLLSDNDLLPYFYVAECYLSNNQKYLAESTLRAALEIHPTEASDTFLQQKQKMQNWLASPTFK